MAETRRCTSCGANLLEEGAARGVCEACLLGVGLDPAPGDSDGVAKGVRIGPYRIVDELGEGGMGLVFLAEQIEPIRRTVALKIVKPGLGGRDVVARFEAERRLVALMDHPNIALVHEAGVTDDGRPYFAMEHVRGRPITTYCDERRLTLAARLELFLQVCRAIQHAHHKGVIHRDIKPGNVLVTELDDRPIVKIIDFGIAKAIEADAGAGGAVTRQDTVVGTPDYMSPEQATSGGRDIDTRTDVYALGLLLYELLAGRPPFVGVDGERPDLDEMRRRVREDDPARPSDFLRSLGSGASAVARARRTLPSALARALRTDLDWVALKALEKDRARRYGSPSDLASDIERYLRDEPVSAGPPGRAYRMRKFVRRHRLGVSVAFVGMLVLTSVAVTLSFQARRIARERDRANREARAAEQVSEFVVELFRVSDPSEARGDALSARQILDAGAARIESELSSDPDVRARLMATMGVVYKNLGDLDTARTLLERARATQRARLGARNPETLQTSLEVAELLFLREEYAHAEAILRETLDGAHAALGEDHPITLSAAADLAVLVQQQGRFAEAEVLYTDALARRRRVLGADDPATIETASNLSTLLFATGRPKAAEPVARAAFEGRVHALGPDHPDTVDSMMNLGVILQVLGRYAEAEEICRRAVAINRRVRPDHPKTLVSVNNLGKILDLEGRYDEAEPLYREALEAFRRTLGDEHTDTITAMGNLGELYTSQGRYREAEALLLEATAAAQRALPHEHVVNGYTLRKYGRLLGRTGRLEAAEKTLHQAVTILEATAGPEHAQTRQAVTDLEEVKARIARSE